MVLRHFVEEPKGSVANYPCFERGKDSITAYLYRLFQERIVMFDGPMGTMIQKHKLGEEEYRGERFKVSDGLLTTFAPLLLRVLPAASSDLRAKLETFLFWCDDASHVANKWCEAGEKKQVSSQPRGPQQAIHKPAPPLS